MRRAIGHAAAGDWPVGEAAETVTLDFDARFRRRMVLHCDGGRTVLLDLPKAVPMAEGDGLWLEEGGWIAVRAKPEPLVEIRAGDGHALLRLAWHLGNRHLPTEIDNGVLRIRPDHVIEAMLEGLGATLTRVERAFQPEGGAYGGHAGHGHSHDHGHDAGHGGRIHHHHHGHDHDGHDHAH
jgi:urease accessory protein